MPPRPPSAIDHRVQACGAVEGVALSLRPNVAVQDFDDALALGGLEDQADESEAGTASPAGDLPAPRRGVSHGGRLEPRAAVSSRNPRRRWRRIPVEPSPSEGQPSNYAPPPGNLEHDAPIGAHVFGARA